MSKEEQVQAVINAYKEISGTAKVSSAEKFVEADRLRTQAKALEQEAKSDLSGMTKAFDRAASAVRFPVDKGEVVPWVRNISADQLIMGIGDDEYLVMSASDQFTPHLYGKPSESGHRFCSFGHDNHGPVQLESYDLAVLGEPRVTPVPSEVEVKDDSRKQS